MCVNTRNMYRCLQKCNKLNKSHLVGKLLNSVKFSHKHVSKNEIFSLIRRWHSAINSIILNILLKLLQYICSPHSEFNNCRVIWSQFTTNTPHSPYLNQCTHGHVWNGRSNSLRGSGAFTNGWTGIKNAFVNCPFSGGAPYNRGLSVSRDKYLKDWGRVNVGAVFNLMFAIPKCLTHI